MDPLSTASAFATIVGLIGQFRGEKSGGKQSDFNDFLEWLIKTQHEDLKLLLETNTRATIGIKALLNEDREVILQKLESLDIALSSFASGISGFAEVAEAINPDSSLSKQAIAILCQFDKSGGSKLLESHNSSGMALLILDGSSGNIEIQEPRFIEDDLRSLVELRLLRHDYNSKGDNLYIYTRSAAQLVNSINTNS